VPGEVVRAKKPRPPSLVDALIPIVILVVFLAAAVYLYGGDAIGGPVQVALILTALVAGIIGVKNGHSAALIGKAATDSIATAVGAIFILLSVGSLIGAWNMSGTIATMTYWGIKILNPNWYYVAAAVVCALIALGIGSAWTVIGTLGVSLIAIATALGVSPEMTAGAVISGAYFGDKISPLSETTNLAPAVAGTDLYTHIKAMMATTIPSITIALALYTVFGLREDVSDAFDLGPTLDAISHEFHIGIVPILPLLVVIFLAMRRVSPTVSIMAGALTGGLVAVIAQPDVVLAFVNDPSLSTPWAMIKGVWDAMATGFVADTGFPGLDTLLSGGGMSSMMDTVWLIMSALAFGGIMDYTGMLGRIIDPLVRNADTDRKILASTGVTAIGINVIAADQYLAIVLTGNVYKTEYEERGIAPQTLSRQIEDTATVTSPLIPWNSCGAYVAGTLGIETMAYLPFAFFNWINPLISFIYAFLGIKIQHVQPETGFEKTPEEARFYGIGGQDAAEVPFEGDEVLPPARRHERPDTGEEENG
jgi:NhaC family Na+:H+ antiporter